MSFMKALLVTDDDKNQAILEQALRTFGCQSVAHAPFRTAIKKPMETVQPDLVVFELDTPDQATLNNIETINRLYAKPVIVFAEGCGQAMIQQVIKAGVSAFVVDDLRSTRIQTVLEIAMSRFQVQQALKEELADAKVKLEERKLIDRAKSILINKRQLSEDEAYKTLRKLAMDRSIPLAEMARNVIAMADLMG